MRSRLLGDPGPCPVDDTPHTACTSEGASSLTVPLRRPRVLDAVVTPPVEDAVEFTTATYKRRLHHPQLRKRTKART
jgi:hypothetical protein